MLYVVNVEACIHQENYGIFFYEPAAKQKIELFEAKWTFESLTDVFSQIAAHINRREFEDNDYQVIVCVRKHKRASRHQMNAQLIWHDTTLYAKTLTARALEQSGMTSVLTSSYTRKIKIVFLQKIPGIFRFRGLNSTSFSIVQLHQVVMEILLS